MKKIKVLYTNIGRGHPFYLDGILEELNRDGGINSVHSKSTVFEHASGLSLIMWKLVRALYQQGGKENLISKIYKRIRKNNDYNSVSLIIKLLGRDIKKEFRDDCSRLVVAHPILVAILRNRKNLYYQHGELIAPKEAIVKGADKIFVPTETVKKHFLKHYASGQIVVTGLCIEPSIVRIAQDAYEARINRFESQKKLTGCFISSGAEPVAHIRIIIDTLVSHLKLNGNAIIFVKKDGRLAKSVKSILGSMDVKYIYLTSLEQVPYELPQLTIVEFSNRRDENRLTSHFFYDFDFIVSPSHERSNWAVGLGLPMFITDPPIGPFSPLNREYLIKTKTGMPIKTISDAKEFALQLKKMHVDKTLQDMAQNGWGKHPIDGFQKISMFLKNNL